MIVSQIDCVEPQFINWETIYLGDNNLFGTSIYLKPQFIWETIYLEPQYIWETIYLEPQFGKFTSFTVSIKFVSVCVQSQFGKCQSVSISLWTPLKGTLYVWIYWNISLLPHQMQLSCWTRNPQFCIWICHQPLASLQGLVTNWSCTNLE